MALRNILLGSMDDIVEGFIEREGLRLSSEPGDAEFLIVLYSTGSEPSMLENVLEGRRGAVVFTFKGHRSLKGVPDVLHTYSRRGVKVFHAHIGGEGEAYKSLVKGIRSASIVYDLSIIHFGWNEGPGGPVIPGWSHIVYPPHEATKTVEEGFKYGGLYIGTYLSEYYNVEGLDEDKLSKSLGVYLAFRSVLESLGGNTLLVNCSIVEGLGADPWLAIHLLADEGIPAACNEDYRWPLSMMLSLALSGKPPIVAETIDYNGGDMVVEPLLVPTLVSSERRLRDSRTGYRPVNTPRSGEYTVISLSKTLDRVYISECILEDETLKECSLQGIPSSLLHMIPGRHKDSVETAFRLLGI